MIPAKPGGIPRETNCRYGAAPPLSAFRHGRTRAVEEGLPLSASPIPRHRAIDAQGRVVAHTSLDAVGFADVVLPAAMGPTLYSIAGDWIFLGLLLMGAAIALGCVRWREIRG
jgi:apolipoprotein N-acyltransferase